MNTQQDHGVHTGSQGNLAQDSVLDRVDRAVAERMETGHVDEARFGFVARVANATPPADEAFQQALRARILTELARGATAARLRMPILRFRRLALTAIVAAAMILVLVLAVAQQLDLWAPERTGQATNDIPALQLAAGDVDALVKELNRQPAGRTVVVYPEDYAATLAEHIQHQVVPLVLGGDGTPDIKAALASVLPASGLVDVILVSQGANGAARAVRVALEQHLYRLEDAETFGALEWNRFVVGAEDVTLEPIGAVFDSGIVLVAAGVLDGPRPGAPVLLAFDWRVMEPVAASPAIFTHLTHEGRPITQRDAVPGNGLFPVETWEPGELVRDQFALPLPPELPPGEYEIQVGIYDPTTQMRYGLIELEGETYVVVQRFTIEGDG
jgi:hypothetical protein